MIHIQAPGKVVVWGEYAVLAGATAGVLAIDRMATVALEPETPFWSFTSSGFQSPGHFSHRNRFSITPAAALANAVLQGMGYDTYPAPFHLHTDTAGFYHTKASQKLGLGSSAAACVATMQAFAQWLQPHKPLNWEDAHLIHQAFQGGTGSGLDIAASWHGGLIHYTMEQPAAPSSTFSRNWPEPLAWGLVWTGASTQTPAAIKRFSAWRAESNTESLDQLVICSDRLAESFTLENMENYVRALKAFDAAAQQNIYTAAHQAIEDLAQQHGLVYKPCGAGGGDIGMVFAENTNLLAFREALTATPYQWLNSSIANL